MGNLWETWSNHDQPVLTSDLRVHEKITWLKCVQEYMYMRTAQTLFTKFEGHLVYCVTITTCLSVVLNIYTGVLCVLKTVFVDRQLRHPLRLLMYYWQ